jgi:hypothetical protein
VPGSESKSEKQLKTTTKTSLELHKWTHVTLKLNNRSVAIYLDGKLDTQKNAEGPEEVSRAQKATSSCALAVDEATPFDHAFYVYI